jgi:hypothetical protein
VITSRSCCLVGCNNKRFARGYCQIHYNRLLRHGDPNVRLRGVNAGKCKVSGCPNPSEKLGLCGKHYQRQWKHGTFEDRRLRTHCSVQGCTRAPRSRSAEYCETHYYRLRRNGSLQLTITPKTPSKAGHCDQCGKPTETFFCWVFCSARCEARHRREIVEQRRFCLVCKKPLPDNSMRSKVYCSWICQRQASGKRANLDLLGERDGWKCHICGRKVKRADATQDHIIPASQGGTAHLSNLALAHKSCNCKRGAGRIPAQMRLQ